MPRIFFNGKRKIPRDKVSVVLRPGRPPEFVADIDLSHLRRKLPANAQVIVEAYHNTMIQRFDFGTSADCRPRCSLRLTEFDERDRPRFRVRVIDVDKDRGSLLASCERVDAVVPEESSEGGRSMLKLVGMSDREMRGEFWCLKEIGGGYQIWYNKDVREVEKGIKGKSYETLVFILTAALRELLERILLWDE